MSMFLTINVKNMTGEAQDFYFFQQPSIYSDGRQVFSNSLYSGTLPDYDGSGAILTFEANLQYYAGFEAAHGMPQIDQPSGFSAATCPIDLANQSGVPGNDWTTASIDPPGLSQPTPGNGVPPGTFRISTPAYPPGANYNVGSAVQANAGVVLSNFVEGNPSTDMDCQPILTFYVQTGDYSPGTVFNFTEMSFSAAVCDFTLGYSVFDVTLNADSTWSVMILQ